jgi:hypothetical protein
MTIRLHDITTYDMTKQKTKKVDTAQLNSKDIITWV